MIVYKIERFVLRDKPSNKFSELARQYCELTSSCLSPEIFIPPPGSRKLRSFTVSNTEIIVTLPVNQYHGSKLVTDIPG